MGLRNKLGHPAHSQKQYNQNICESEFDYLSQMYIGMRMLNRPELSDPVRLTLCCLPDQINDKTSRSLKSSVRSS